MGRFLIGKTPYQIEIALGLESNKITGGAKIYKFKRLPLLNEVEYELTADHPGGLHYNPAHSNPKYLPGAPHIHQWQIKPGVQIPVDGPGALILKQGQVFPYSWIAT